MDYKGKYTHQEVLENLSPDELKEIEEKVIKLVYEVWEGPDRRYYPTQYDYCSFCQADLPYEHRVKTRVICNVMDLSCECASCFAKRREQQFIEEAIDRKKNVRNGEKPGEPIPAFICTKPINKTYKPSFDIDDFARI